MFKFESVENAILIRNYLNKEVQFEKIDFKLENLSMFETFNSELCKISKSSQSKVLASLIGEYEFQTAMKVIFSNYTIAADIDPNLVISSQLKVVFRELTLEIARKIMSARFDEKKKLIINKKIMAERVMELFDLKINKKNPETLFVYCHKNGRFENGTIPINRLIIELSHFLGEYSVDSWTVHIEKSIIDILNRKVEIVNAERFNGVYFPFSNATLDSESVTMVPHSPQHLALLGSGIEYNPKETCPLFEQFLSQIFMEKETIAFVQEWFGYSLFHGHESNVLLLGIGLGGNGKSTLADMLAQLVGKENVSSVPLSNLNKEFGLEPLLDMKLNVATESDIDGFKTGKLKAVTAGETISVNRKNKPEVSVTLPIKLMFLLNELPLLTDRTYGLERRLIILPFDQLFTPDIQDKDLSKKLTAELSGILNWSMLGLKRLMTNGFIFTESAPMVQAKRTYLGVGNPVEEFVKDKIKGKPTNRIPSKDILSSYRLWMDSKGYPYKGTGSPKTFWRLFDEVMAKNLISYDRKKSNGTSFIYDIEVH